MVVGGMITSNKKWWWDIQGRTFLIDELENELQAAIDADWSLFASATYFM